MAKHCVIAMVPELLLQNLTIFKGPCTQSLSTWDLGNSNYSIGFG